MCSAPRAEPESRAEDAQNACYILLMCLYVSVIESEREKVIHQFLALSYYLFTLTKCLLLLIYIFYNNRNIDTFSDTTRVPEKLYNFIILCLFIHIVSTMNVLFPLHLLCTTSRERANIGIPCCYAQSHHFL